MSKIKHDKIKELKKRLKYLLKKGKVCALDKEEIIEISMLEFEIEDLEDKKYNKEVKE